MTLNYYGKTHKERGKMTVKELFKQIEFRNWKRIMDNTGKQRIGVKSYEGKRSIKESYKEYGKGNESGQGDC